MRILHPICTNGQPCSVAMHARRIDAIIGYGMVWPPPPPMCHKVCMYYVGSMWSLHDLPYIPTYTLPLPDLCAFLHGWRVPFRSLLAACCCCCLLMDELC